MESLSEHSGFELQNSSKDGYLPELELIPDEEGVKMFANGFVG